MPPDRPASSSILDTLQKEYVVIGTRRVQSLHAWTTIGLILVGAVSGVAFVANRSGEFNTSRAAYTVNVYSAPGGALIGTQPVNTAGTIINGPQTAGGYTWWRVNYDSGVDGWTVEDNLVKSGLPLPPGTPTPTPTPLPTTVSCSFTRDLTIGSTGSDVVCLQQALISAGYSLPVGATGYFGLQTRSAVSAWQTSVGISTPSGSFGPLSRAKWSGTPVTSTTVIQTPVSSPFTRDLSVGSIGSDVRALQRYLNNHGFVVSVVGPGSRGNETTTFGLATQAALSRFQTARGIIPAAGYFGPRTRALVNGSL